MKRWISAFLAMVLAVSLLGMNVFASGDNHADVSHHIPVVAVRVNGEWFAADLTQYRGQDNVWVEIPINAGKLNSEAENYFSLRTNVNNTGDFCDGSADIYATAVSAYNGSFLCSDPWCDNGYTAYNDRSVNIKVQVYTGGEWKTLAEDASYAADQHTVLGQFQGGDWYNAARNIVLPAFEGVTKARILVNMHVGKDIVPLENYASLENYQMNQIGWFYSNDPILKVRVNGTWYGVGLEDLRGQENVWAYCPIDLSALKAGETNYLQISSNVKNGGNMSASSLDLYCSDYAAGDSFVTNNQWCDDGWAGFSDRTVNARIELYDGDKWTVIPSGESYNTNADTGVIGLFSENSTYYNYARNIAIGNVDLSGYQAARIAVNVHVGSNIDCDPFVIWDLANFREPVKEKPTYTVTASEGQGGSVSGAPADTVVEGTRITLTATAGEGYTFGGWYRDGVQISAENPYVFTAAENVTLEARFNAAVIPTCTVTVTAGEGGSASGGAVVNENSQITVSAEAASGYLFDGWYAGDKKVSADAAYTFTVTADITLEARFTAIAVDDGHKHTPDAPGAAESTTDDSNAAIKVRVNGTWYARYIGNLEGRNNVWVPVYIDIEKLNSNAENYFNFGSNVISHGNYTDSSIDLFASFADEGLSSFLTNHQWCDTGWVGYSDRNINVKLQLFNGTDWVTVAPVESTYYDEHTVLGKFDGDGNFYNAARNLMVGDLSGYTQARVLVNLHIGTKLDVAEDFMEETFGTFMEIPKDEVIPSTGDRNLLPAVLLLSISAAAAVLLIIRRKVFS